MRSVDFALRTMVCAWFVGAVSASQASAAGLARAAAFSKETGLPMLVVVSSDSCPHCVRLMQRLSSDPTVVPLVKQFVPIEVKVGTNDHKLFTSQIPPVGNGVPQVYVVSSSGETVSSTGGAPQGDSLNRILADAIQKTGGPKDLSKLGQQDEIEKKLAATVRRVKLMIASGRTAEAIAALSPVLEGLAADNDGESAKQLRDLAGRLATEADKRLKQAQTLAESKADAAKIALLLAGVKKDYASLPAVNSALDASIAKLGASHQAVALIEPAEELYEAQKLLADPRGKRRAQRLLQQVAEDHADSPIGELAAAEIVKLTGEPVAQAASFPLRTWADQSGKFQIRARYAGASGKNVVLEKPDGTTLEVPHSRLSDEDQKYSIEAYQTANK